MKIIHRFKPNSIMEQREIKFRVWHDNLMWKHGSLQFDMLPFGLSQKTFFEFDGIESGEIITGGSSQDFTLLQYTGIKDKNGKEIYEGDIITTPVNLAKEKHNAIGVVTYLGAGFVSVGIGDYKGGHYPLQYNSQIIGNIYEHPNLLETTPEPAKSTEL